MQVNQSLIMNSVPKECLGAIFGRNGSTIRMIQSETRTKVNICKSDLKIEIFGQPENQKKARFRIKDIIVSRSISVFVLLASTSSLANITGENRILSHCNSYIEIACLHEPSSLF